MDLLPTETDDRAKYKAKCLAGSRLKNILHLIEPKDDKKQYTSASYFMKHRLDEFADRKVKTVRTIGEEEIMKILDEYNTDKVRVVTNPVSKGSGKQTKYAFSEKYKMITFKGVEINCRMITTQASKAFGGEEDKYNISRIGDIRFKSKTMQDIFTTIADRVREEVNLYNPNAIVKIHNCAIYARDHAYGNNCYINCPRISKTLKTMDTYKDYFSCNVDQTIENKACYSQRQVIGEQFIPYIDKSDKTDSMDGLIFDNMYVNPNGNLYGEARNRLLDEKRERSLNFFDTVSREPATAFLTFRLDYVGVAQQGMTIYLAPHSVIYCTTLSSSLAMDSASEFLNSYALRIKIIKKEVKKRKNIDMDDDILNDILCIDNEEDNSKKNRKKRSNNTLPQEDDYMVKKLKMNDEGSCSNVLTDEEDEEEEEDEDDEENIVEVIREE